MTETYQQWLKKVEAAAMSSIGKTMNKRRSKDVESEILNKLHKERRELKVQFASETRQMEKAELKQLYIQKQDEVRNQLEEEKKQKLQCKMRKMMSDTSQNTFWKERAKVSRNDTENY